MTAARRLATACILAGLLVACGDDSAGPPAERLFPPPGPERVAALLREIESPTELPIWNNGIIWPRGERPEISKLVPSYYLAREAGEDLADAEGPVDVDLLRMVRSNTAWAVRCRAARVLASRGHAETPSLLAALTRSVLPVERFVAWGLCRDHARPVAPVPAAETVERLRSEGVDEVVDAILDYVGAIEAREATPLLLSWVRAGRHSRHVVDALGRLRVAEAVPVLLAAQGADPRDVIRALGRIGTPEAVDHLLAHVDDDGATDALVESHDPRARLAIEARLARLRARPTATRYRPHEHEAQIGLIRLRTQGPAPALLDLAEDATLDAELRCEAMRALKAHCPMKDYETRLARVYAKESDPGVLYWCELALLTSRAPGVTEAMLHHALLWRSTWKADDELLVRAINRRLGTTYANLDEVRALATARGIR